VRILIADDDRISRRLLERTLERLGHEVVAVTDGLTALAALVGPDAPQLAILDWMMPGTDGLSVCRLLRQRTAPYVYVILLTARDRREDMMAGLEAGADDFLTKPFDSVELQARLSSGERVLALQERLLAAQDALRVQATHDRLTGLWNRGMILDELERQRHRASRDGAPLAVVLADVDRFKSVNDTHGHAAGDVVLGEIASRMSSALRASDALGRYGGEEFLLVLPGCDAAGASTVADRVRQSVAAEPVRVDGIALDVSVSLGVASTFEPLGLDVGTLVATADRALYRAKALGRNRVELRAA